MIPNKYNKILALNVLFMCLGSVCIGAQDTYFRHLTVDQGLSQNSVVSITQDEAGYMWFATQDGLNQYDGNSIKKYNRFFNDITQSTYSYLGKIIHDPDGNLWISNLNGITEVKNKYLNKFDTISTSLHLSAVEKISSDEYIIGSYGAGLKRYYTSSSTFSDVPLLGNDVYAIKKIDSVTYLLSTELGLVKYDVLNGATTISPPIEGSMFSDIDINAFGEVYVSTYGQGLYRLNGDHLVRVKKIPGYLNIQDIHFDSNNQLWVATYGEGVFLINEEVTQFKHEKGNSRSLGYNDILCIYEGEGGILWFGTDGGGVSYFDPESFRFSSLLNDLLPQEIHVDVVRSISADNRDLVWIGTSGFGLTRYNIKNKSIKAYLNDENRKNTLSGNRIVALRHDANGDLWVGTQENGLNILSPNGRIRRINDIPATTIWIIYPDGRGNMWLGTRNEGLLLYNKNKGVLQQINLESHPQIQSNNIRAIAPGKNGKWYIGTEEHGIFSLSIHDYAVHRLPTFVTAREIKYLYADDNTLWIGQAKNGLGIWRQESSNYTTIDESKGLPNNVVYSILPGKNGDLWISTNKGICSFSKSTILEHSDMATFNCYGIDDGLQGMEFNTGASFIREDGVLFFGGLKGINWIDPTTVKEKQLIHKPLITDVIVNNSSLSYDTILHYKKSLTLDYDQNYFNVRFLTPDFSQQANQEYAYRLLGLNDNWTFAGRQEVASFTNVPPDDYIFEITMVTDGEVSDSRKSKLSISIQPAFWQTWWFRIGGSLLILAGISIGYKKRTQYLKDLKKTSEQIKELEMLVLRSQMNPHFLFNSLNSIKSYILKSDKLKASEYLSDFAHMVRMILQNSREKEISLSQELESLKLYIALEKMRLKQDIEVKYFIDSTINLDGINIPPLLLQPYVENAIWHGLMPKKSGGKLHISLLRENAKIICRIDDNGIGRSQSLKNKEGRMKPYKSMGMGITKDRVDLHNKVSNKKIEIHITDKQSPEGIPSGTSIDITLPLDEY
jgi:ligand-binding sensor domain-containing protein